MNYLKKCALSPYFHLDYFEVRAISISFKWPLSMIKIDKSKSNYFIVYYLTPLFFLFCEFAYAISITPVRDSGKK